jgi:DNA processing protein
LKKSGALSDASIASLKDPALLSAAEEQIKLSEQNGIRIYTLGDNDYPPLLREIFAPPPVLYAKGLTGIFSPNSIGVVGMRHPGIYGINAVKHIVKELTDNAITIVSGMALGIDSYAHATCLDNKGTTIAVLGCGIDRIYPPSNHALAERIEKHGAIISEFPLGTPPLAYNFPQRNRIISGLSAGVLVVEAAGRSGSLITAHFAIQQGRDVFAIPGPIFSEKSDGTFNLLKQGAIPVRSAQDILDTIAVMTAPGLKKMAPSSTTRMPLELLNTEERLVVESITSEPQRIDQIADRINKKVNDLFSILLNLELKGIVKQVAGQQYVRL